jgi:hypothetical protein
MRHNHKLPLRHLSTLETTHIVKDHQWTVDTADGVVAYPGLDRHHAGVYYVGHDDGDGRFIEG